jgi:hypothetical protein
MKPKILGIQEVLAILGEGNFNQIIGSIESEMLDFKREPYQLNSTKQKLELAKDVSAFANNVGGVILMGVNTCKEEGRSHELANRIRLFDETLIDVKQYEDIINAYIYPRLNVEIKWIPSAADGNKGLAYVRIPEAESQRKPFLITKVLGEDERELGSYIGFFQRKGDNIPSLTAEAMQHALKEGLRFDDHLTEIKEGIGKLLSERKKEDLVKTAGKVLTRVKKPTPADISTKKVAHRINDAIKAVGLADDIAYVLVAFPTVNIQIEGLFESRNTDVVKLIDEPRQLRYAGFDISTQERSRIINGELRRAVLKPYKLLEVWRDGMIVFVTDGGEGFLCWGNYDTTKLLRINTIALIESTYLFHDFVQKVYSTSKASKCRLTTQLLLRNLPCPEHYALSTMHPASVRWYANVDLSWASSSEIQAQRNFDWDKTIAERATYDLVSETYVKFGVEHEFIPYVTEVNKEKVIDVEQIKAIR